jgi:hypothetical protein
MFREPDLIDVWFDSGAMPYAQFHYPFEKGDHLNDYFPADFIAEGVDQTRGWFFTLHAIATMVFDSVAYKTCVSNGLVLDKNGNKMSKRLGNAVDPFQTIAKFGADATRWYMITNAQPWDNLKFDTDGIVEVQRKFFGTLYNTYAFFALYANIDGFTYDQEEIPMEQRPELDRWILSELNTLIKQVDEAFDDFEPTRAGRAISQFVDYKLSNWYVRLSRRRFWKGELSTDKTSAYQTLYRCLDAAAVLQFEQHQIHTIEANGTYNIEIDGQNIELNLNDVEIFTEDIPGWVVTNLGNLTVALDITISPELLNEGIARELINRIQNLRKDKGFEVTDTIRLMVEKRNGLDAAIEKNYLYICSETLAESLELSENINDSGAVQVELTDDLTTSILISKS